VYSIPVKILLPPLFRRARKSKNFADFPVSIYGFSEIFKNLYFFLRNLFKPNNIGNYNFSMNFVFLSPKFMRTGKQNKFNAKFKGGMRV